MYKSLVALIAVVVVAVSAADEQQLGQARFFAVTQTVVKASVSTSTKTVTVQSTCASLVNVTGACRRRRGFDEKPLVISFDDDVESELFKPSSVQAIEASAAPLVPEAKSAAEELVLKFENFYPELRSSAALPEEVEIIGLDNDCVRARSPFFLNNLFSNFLTIVFTTTATATVTTTTTVTSGSKPFIVSGCTPSPFPYKAC